jgi:hypothetical protein
MGLDALSSCGMTGRMRREVRGNRGTRVVTIVYCPLSPASHVIGAPIKLPLLTSALQEGDLLLLLVNGDQWRLGTALIKYARLSSYSPFLLLLASCRGGTLTPTSSFFPELIFSFSSHLLVVSLPF